MRCCLQKKIPGHKLLTPGHITTLQKWRNQVSDQHLNVAPSALIRDSTHPKYEVMASVFVYLMDWRSAQITADFICNVSAKKENIWYDKGEL